MTTSKQTTMCHEAANIIAAAEDSARSVFVFGGSVNKSWEIEQHHHRKAQLLYVVRGIINCEMENGLWIVPPQCAIWIPKDITHAVHGSGETECYCLFVDPAKATGLPKSCSTLEVSPLLRELIFKAASFSRQNPLHEAEERLTTTLLDELAVAQVEDLHLPMPKDSRLRYLADLMLANPTDKKTIGEWAYSIGMSERSMTRLLLHNIGMSFGRWRRQLHVILALQQLTKGESVQTVALDLGYENASSFITMFRKAVGKSPMRYLTDRKGAGLQSRVPGIILPALI